MSAAQELLISHSNAHTPNAGEACVEVIFTIRTRELSISAAFVSQKKGANLR